jgi:hypothetical protein
MNLEQGQILAGNIAIQNSLAQRITAFHHNVVYALWQSGISHEAQNQIVQVFIAMRSIHADHFVLVKSGKNDPNRIFRSQVIFFTIQRLARW